MGSRKYFKKFLPHLDPSDFEVPEPGDAAGEDGLPAHGDQSEESRGSRDLVSANHSSPAHRDRHVVHAAQEHRLSGLPQAPYSHTNY